MRLIRQSTCLKDAVLIAFVASLTPTSAHADAAGEQALAGMAAAYASLRSYQDTGEVLFKIMG
jgi:outer membrane lipoprotein-sorting protein